MTHKVSTETIRQYNCGACGMWSYVPMIGSSWKHKRTGRKYDVVEVANIAADPERADEYPVTIVYRDEKGFVWARPESKWHDYFEFLEGPQAGAREGGA